MTGQWPVDRAGRLIEDRAMSSRLARALRVALLISLFLAVLGGNLAVIARYGSDLPHWDQWDAEGAQAILPYLQHRLTLADLIAPNNEHRVACTRILALGLLALNGQWDARLECVVNAAMFAALAVLFFRYGARFLGRGRQAAWFLAVAALTAPPVAWQNVISGFHSQQYFLIGFSLVTLALLLTAPPWTARWWAGVGCAFAALFTMASGLLAAATVIAVLALEGRPREVWRRHGITLAACLSFVMLGWALRVIIAQNAVLEAHSVRDFAVTFWRSLQWPADGFAPLALLVWLPWALWAWRHWRRSGAHSGRDRVLFAAGAWVILQFAATAYGRGAGGAWPASRYLDTVVIGLLVNVLALLVLPAAPAAASWKRWLRPALTILWFGVVGAGVVRHLARVIRVELPPAAADLRQEELDTRAYLVTGDAHDLDGPIPYPNKKALIERLSHAEIRSVLPAGVRPPLALGGTADPPGSFVHGGLPASVAPLAGDRSWGSFTAAGRANEGEWQSSLLFRPFSGYWRFTVAGDLGRPGVSLEIMSHTTASPLARVVPRRPPGNAWRTVVVPAPDTSALVVARDTSPTAWFAFSDPVEMGPLSYWAWRLSRIGGRLALAAAIAAAALLGVLAWGPRARLDADGNNSLAGRARDTADFFPAA